MGSKGSKPKVPSITFNFSSPPATDEERRLVEDLEPTLSKTTVLLEQLDSYTGCEKFIQNALNDPNQDTEKEAWNAVEKSVAKLYKFYKFALAMENDFPRLLAALSSGAPETNLQGNQALVRQLAEVFDFAFHFDEKKMVNPAIQNDFSYYRRVLSRMKSGTAKQKKTKTKVNEEVANKMSFFFAYPTPMMKALIDTSTKSDNATDFVNGLALLANVCVHCIENEKDTFSAEDRMRMLCMMTGAIILVDHLTQLGAFHKKSPIRIKACISLLRNYGDNSTDFLLNSLRFTTLHLNDEQTMSDIKKLLL